jgi:ABC-type amino acid transport system permease subunit
MIQWLIIIGYDLGIVYLIIGLLAGLSNTRVRDRSIWIYIPHLEGSPIELLINIVLITLIWPQCIRRNKLERLIKIKRKQRHARTHKQLR